MDELEKRKIELRNHKGKIVRHFKGKDYLILDFAIYTETEEELVIYKALYSNCGVFARPIDMFVSEVDHRKYPQINQKLRFELVESIS
ncbi:DUF1653 domain-containing protein [Desulfosporosinus sp. BG]|uniref:DUF1653 domain-containing protein n=1 Tax=Desulfosporosinus sp. BG TaxID=1633135 RepID=UPI00083B5314|nr:DUF1653 domain-containing protein [Desulfosporosinus sp. BG]ODA42688.1 hypothetical protein DSBG_0562 [Desulfosporosinus sp. BG]